MKRRKPKSPSTLAEIEFMRQRITDLESLVRGHEITIAEQSKSKQRLEEKLDVYFKALDAHKANSDKLQMRDEQWRRRIMSLASHADAARHVAHAAHLLAKHDAKDNDMDLVVVRITSICTILSSALREDEQMERWHHSEPA